MASKKQKDRKYELADQLKEHFLTYKKLFLVDADNVGSNQLHQIRMALRGKALVYCGKNTQMRRVIRELEGEGHSQLEKIRLSLKLNLAIVFTNDNLSQVRDLILDNKVAAPARAGSIAQCDVVVPAGNTGMEPTMTSFLQALNIPSKITKGSIEILNPVDLIAEGEKCEASQCALLEKLGIKPFSYGLKVKHVYDDGAMYDPAVLDISDDDIVSFFGQGVKQIAALSLETGLPSVAAVPYSILLAFKNLLAVTAETDYTFPEAQGFKDFLENPEAFAAAAGPAAPAGADAPKEEEKKESSSEEDDGAAMGMFGDDY